MCSTGDMDIYPFSAVLIIIRDRKEKHKENIHIYIYKQYNLKYFISQKSHIYGSEM
jgi:hypothetical protein